jgi:single-stranded DNA-binding protein
LHCAVTGNVIGKPTFRMVKNGTVPMLDVTVVYPEHDGKTSVCRATVFGDQAKAIAGKVGPDCTVGIEGMVTVNSWEKDGEKRHGLATLARRIKVMDEGHESVRLPRAPWED